jgi:cyclopropane-fatty-acyl-phospholipid synthase
LSAKFSDVVSRFEKRHADYFGPAAGPAFALQSPDGIVRAIGRGSPAFTIAATNKAGLDALATLDRLIVAEAYLSGNLEIEGDLLTVVRNRTFFSDTHPLATAWHFIKPKIMGQTKADAGAISDHYDVEADFFLFFLDKRHRCYSHGVFERDDESLEDAITRKLDFAIDSIGAKRGDRVLDVGGGWGAFTQYAGQKGVRVTSLTISRESERYMKDLIQRERLPCEAIYEHLYEHQPSEPYDAIVIVGVTEHIPDYDRSLAKYESMLKPGGKVYACASAKRKKYDVSSFQQRHIFPGNGSPMCLHDYLRAVAESPFQLESVHCDGHSYALTARHWAEGLERNREEIERRWGKAQYRKFRLYLWGAHDGFSRDDIQAYRVVMGLPKPA